jgi:hypothetical protein
MAFLFSSPENQQHHTSLSPCLSPTDVAVIFGPPDFSLAVSTTLIWSDRLASLLCDECMQLNRFGCSPDAITLVARGEDFRDANEPPFALVTK